MYVIMCREQITLGSVTLCALQTLSAAAANSVCVCNPSQMKVAMNPFGCSECGRYRQPVLSDLSVLLLLLSVRDVKRHL